jgi:hypothetical protein
MFPSTASSASLGFNARLCFRPVTPTALPLRPDTPMRTINVIYGAHELVVDDFNLTVSEWAAALQDVISLGEDAVPFRNGHRAEWNDGVEAGDRVEFFKRRGRKGSNSDAGMSVLQPGDATLTRRCKKRCEAIGVEVRTTTKWNGWGYVVTGYLIPTSILEEEQARRESERAAARAKEAVDSIRRQQEKLSEVRAAHPSLTEDQIAQIDPALPVYCVDEVGYLHGRAIESYWASLGFLVPDGAKPCGTLIDGSNVLPLFSALNLQEQQRTTSTEAIWEKYCSKYRGPVVALAEAIKTANRLQKVRKNARFYPLKDRWIQLNQSNLAEGLIAREEVRTCWSCDGYSECYRCGGTGIYSTRTLYEHRFVIEGRKYSFHSYLVPTTVTGEGANLIRYGLPFAGDELPLPPQSQLVEMISARLAGQG